jgi:CubicO group peptidase (beta-lactamase class C family)
MMPRGKGAFRRRRQHTSPGHGHTSPGHGQMPGSHWRTALRCAALVALLAGGAARARAQDTTVYSDPQFRAALGLVDASMQAYLEDQRLPGLSVAVVYGDSVVFAKGYGYADVEHRVPATPQTVYRVASISKCFTATMLMQLRDAGEVRLDDPVSRFLPSFRLQHPQPGAPPITLRELATHTSGLEREADISYWRNDTFPSRDSLIAMLSREPPPFAPMHEHKYSNVGFSLLGWALEAAAGEPYAEYVQRHILGPLGMHSSGMALTPAIQARLATGYVGPTATQPLRPAHAEEFHGLVPAAGLYTTPLDLARFAMLQFEGPRDTTSAVLRGSSVHQMQTVQWMEPDWKSGQGIGLALWRTADNTLALGHAGYVGGFRSQMSIVPSAKLAVIVMINSEANPAPAATAAIETLLPVVEGITARRSSMQWKTTPVAWNDYLGVYRWQPTDEAYEVRIVEKKLVLWSTDAPAGSYIVLQPDSSQSDTFIQVGGGSAGETVRFTRDAAGHVTAMFVSADRYDRVADCGCR